MHKQLEDFVRQVHLRQTAVPPQKVHTDIHDLCGMTVIGGLMTVLEGQLIR
jgi:hypothetical protein